MLPRILTEELLLITPAGYSRLKALLDPDLANSPPALGRRPKPKADFQEEEPEDPQPDRDPSAPYLEMINGIVRIPIVGPIARDLDPLEKLFFGLVDTNDIAAQLDQAERDPLCRSILLVIDSPGGTFNGTPELASRIEQVQKPIYAYSPGLICSAAYWLAAATDGIFMTQSADAGSIGIYCVFPDLSQAAQMAGVKIQVFSSGKYKGAGVPGTALTQDQAKLLQDRINNLAAMFSGYLAGRRPIAEGDMQGQSFTGADAWDHNLVDAIADNEAEVLALL